MTVSSGTILTGEDPLKISALSLFLFQATLIIGLSKILSLGLRYLRQPAVVAEVIGGLILGGSALSKISAFKEHVFPDASLGAFKLVADFGLVLYLFLIGLELDPSTLIKVIGKSIPISIAGIVLPFALGTGVAKAIYDRYAEPGVSFTSFLIFVGVAMSITAFPVLARILTETNLLHTKVGKAAISAAAVDDFTAWTLLVVVVALINNANSSTAGAKEYLTALYVFLVVLGFAIFLWVAVRPLLRRFVLLAEEREHLSHVLVYSVFLLVLLSGWFMEVIGVQAIFGKEEKIPHSRLPIGFLAGVIIPHENGFARKLASQIEDIVTIVFLPLYFAYSGLKTRIDMLADGTSWGFVFLIITVACAGKLVGCSAAARMSGLNWRESAAVGVLMNTKGLVELIVLNLGLNAKVISPVVFSMFVVMAVITTLMTVPILSFVYPQSLYMKELLEQEDGAGHTTSFLSASDRESAVAVPVSDDLKALLVLPSVNVAASASEMATLLQHPSNPATPLHLHALRLFPSDSRMSTVMQAAEPTETLRSDPALSILRAHADLRGVRTSTFLTAAPNYAETIAETARAAGVSIVIVGARPTDDSIRAAAHDAAKLMGHSTDIVLLIDRGFSRGRAPGPKSILPPGGSSAETLSTAPASTNGVFGEKGGPRLVVLIQTGAPDDSDAMRVARSLRNATPLCIQVGENEPAVSEWSGEKAPQMERVAGLQELADRLKALNVSGMDVVVVGSGASSSESERAAMRHFLDSEVQASVALV
ncbi:K(+)/H(+) antiporter, partial [Irineochytrium annulatum]